MRVLLDVSAVPEQPVGAGVYTIELARVAARHPDIALHLLTRRRDRARWEAICPSAQLHANVPKSRAVRLLWEQTGAPRLARSATPDVWHGPHYTMPLRLSVPTVVTVHDLTFFDHPEWHERSKVVFFRSMIRAAAARARAVVTVSDYTADRLRATVPVSAPIFVARHGVDHDHFRPATPGDTQDDELLASLGVRPPFLAFAGTLEPRKNVPALVRAFARMRTRYPELRLVLAGGDGWGARDVMQSITDNKVGEAVQRLGYVNRDALRALYRGAEAVVYPSREEGFGLPALETLACGGVLVSTTGSAIEEVVGTAAVLVAPDDDDALADAIERVLGDREFAGKLRSAGPEQAAPYTWEASLAQHLVAYEAAARA